MSSDVRDEEIMKEEAEAALDILEEEMKMLAKDGPPGLPVKPQKPAAKLAFYMSQTLPAELPMLLDGEYEIKASMVPPVYPPLMSPYWAGLLSLGRFPSGWSFFKHHVDEFRRLLLTLDKRMTGGVTTEPQSAVTQRSGY